MKKSKKNNRSKRTTQKHGGKKNNTPLLITQMGGLAPAPRPAPAPALAYNLDYSKVLPALKEFANGIGNFVNDTVSDYTYALAHKDVAVSDRNHAIDLSNAAKDLYTAYLGDGTASKPGLYNIVLNKGPVYKPPTEPPAPAPAARSV